MKKIKSLITILFLFAMCFMFSQTKCYAAQSTADSSQMTGKIGDKTFTLLGQKYVKKGTTNLYYLDNSSSVQNKANNYKQFYNILYKAVKAHKQSITVNICTTNSYFKLSHYKSNLLTVKAKDGKTTSCKAYCSEIIDERSYADYKRIIDSTGIQVVWEVQPSGSVIDFKKYMSVKIYFTYFNSDQPVKIAETASDVGKVLNQAFKDGYPSVTLCMFYTGSTQNTDDMSSFSTLISSNEDDGMITSGNVLSNYFAVINRDAVGLTSDNLMVDTDDDCYGNFDWTDLGITSSKITTKDNQRIESDFTSCVCYCKVNLHNVTEELDAGGLSYLSTEEKARAVMKQFSENEDRGFLGYIKLPSGSSLDDTFFVYNKIGREYNLQLTLYDTATDYCILSTY